MTDRQTDTGDNKTMGYCTTTHLMEEEGGEGGRRGGGEGGGRRGEGEGEEGGGEANSISTLV